MELTVKEKCKNFFIGDVTMDKTKLWLIVAVCILFGVVLGFINAPLTHGVRVSCGNNNGNAYGSGKEEKESEE